MYIYWSYGIKNIFNKCKPFEFTQDIFLCKLLYQNITILHLISISNVFIHVSPYPYTLAVLLHKLRICYKIVNVCFPIINVFSYPHISAAYQSIRDTKELNNCRSCSRSIGNDVYGCFLYTAYNAFWVCSLISVY